MLHGAVIPCRRQPLLHLGAGVRRGPALGRRQCRCRVAGPLYERGDGNHIGCAGILCGLVGVRQARICCCGGGHGCRWQAVRPDGQRRGTHQGAVGLAAGAALVLHVGLRVWGQQAGHAGLSGGAGRALRVTAQPAQGRPADRARETLAPPARQPPCRCSPPARRPHSRWSCQNSPGQTLLVWCYQCQMAGCSWPTRHTHEPPPAVGVWGGWEARFETCRMGWAAGLLHCPPWGQAGTGDCTEVGADAEEWRAWAGKPPLGAWPARP